MTQFEDYDNNNDSNNNNEQRSRRRIFDDSNMSRIIRSQRNTDDMNMQLMAQVIAMRKEIRENQLEQSRQFEIQQQYNRTNTKNIRMLMQNPTRNFSGGIRNFGHTNRTHNNNAGDCEIANTIAEDKIQEATGNATLGRCPSSLYNL